VEEGCDIQQPDFASTTAPVTDPRGDGRAALQRSPFQKHNRKHREDGPSCRTGRDALNGGELMACLFDHNWGWPRRRAGKDLQMCLNCGSERESKVRFDGPRYRRTQEGARDRRGAQLLVSTDSHHGLSTVAA
jgi:hypothetical protein